MRTSAIATFSLAALLTALAVPSGATITPYEQTIGESGYDSTGYVWSSAITYRSSPYPDTISFATHACGPVTVQYANQLQYDASCVLEDCQQEYLDYVLNTGPSDESDPEPCKAGDSACCSAAQSYLTHCLQYPTSYCSVN